MSERTTSTAKLASGPSPQGAARAMLPSAGEAVAGGDAVVEDLLVEEVSIDGMCGVY